MRILNFANPFGAPVFHEDTVSSTFDTARFLAARNEKHGTVITADFQNAGKGSVGRPWIADRGQNLLFTILLRYGDFFSIPKALTLRTGLALSLALEDLFPFLAGSVKIKWPNDIIIHGKKLSGILTESDGKTVYIGVGVNIGQPEFPPALCRKAVSIRQIFLEAESGKNKTEIETIDENSRFLLLEKILLCLHSEIEQSGDIRTSESRGTPTQTGEDFQANGETRKTCLWHERLTERLYKRGETVSFTEGKTGSGRIYEGKLRGIGENGEIIILPKGEKKEKAFTSGELQVYSCRGVLNPECNSL